MSAIVFAVVLLLCIWAEVASGVLRRLFPAATAGQRAVYFLLALGVGLLLLLAALQWRIESSVLSVGWTREQLAGFWNALALLLPPVLAWLGWRHAGAAWWQQAVATAPRKPAAAARRSKK